MFDAVLVPTAPGEDAGAAGATAQLIADAVGCEVEHLTVEDGDPVPVLLSMLASRPSTLLCMATSARTGVSELLVGSTTAAVLRAASHSVVVIGPHAAAPESLAVIVACLDGSKTAERAAHAAAVWARMLSARLHLVRVAPESERGDPHDTTVDLERLAADIHRGVGLHPEWEVLHSGDVDDAVVRYAGDVAASLLAVTPHGEGASQRILGSTAMRIVHAARVPVLVAPAPRAS